MNWPPRKMNMGSDLSSTPASERFSGKPYPGLRPFRIEEYPIFFGRDNCLDQMIKSLENDRFLAVIGASGSGKSSLVRAAFFRELQLGLAGTAGTKWQFADIGHPGETNPFDQLARSLLRSKPDRQPGAGLDVPEVETLASQLQEGNFTLHRWFGQPGNVADGANLLILVDQFEELLQFDDESEQEAQGPNGDRRSNGYDRSHVARFVDLLLRTIERSDTPIYVVLTMRAEFLSLCTTFQGLADRFSADAVIPPRMNRDQCRAAIVGPSRYLQRIDSTNKFDLQSELVETLLDELERYSPFEHDQSSPDEVEQDRLDWLSRQSDQLPLMQHVLNQMWREAHAARAQPEDPVVLDREAYRTRGGLAESLAKVGDGIYDSFDARQKQITRRIFCSLIRGTRLRRAVRRPCDLATLAREAGAGEGEVRTIVDRFRDEDVCFLTPFAFHHEPDNAIKRGQKIAISHESLIRQWKALQGWYEVEVKAGAQWGQIVASLGEQTQDFERFSIEKALFRIRNLSGPAQPIALWRGVTLAGYEKWWGEYQPFAGWAARYDVHAKDNFPQADRLLKDSKAWRTTRQRAGLATTATLFVLAIVSVGLFLIYSDQARAARSDRIRIEKEAQDREMRANAAVVRANQLVARAEARLTAANLAETKANLATNSARAAARLATADAASKEALARQSILYRDKAINGLIVATKGEIENYITPRITRESPESREAYGLVRTKIVELREIYPRPNDEDRRTIADASLTGALHATAQFDEVFLDLALNDARETLGTSAQTDTLRKARLKLGEGRFAIWNEDFNTAHDHYLAARLAAESLPSATAKTRIVALAWAGLADAQLKAAALGTLDPAQPLFTRNDLQCGPINASDPGSAVEEATIALQAAQFRCVKARVELSESEEIASEEAKILPRVIAPFSNPTYRIATFKPRVQREIAAAWLARGVRLVEAGQLEKPSDSQLGSVRNAFNDASYATSSWANHIVLSNLASSAYAFDFEGLASSDQGRRIPAPFEDYAFIDVYGYVRARPRFHLTNAEIRERDISAGKREPNDRLMTEREAARLRLAASLVLQRLESGRPNLLLIRGEGERFFNSLLDGASIAPAAFGASADLNIEDFSSVMHMSVSMAADARELMKRLDDDERERSRIKLAAILPAFQALFAKPDFVTDFLQYRGSQRSEAPVRYPGLMDELKVHVDRLCADPFDDRCGLLVDAFAKARKNYEAKLRIDPQQDAGLEIWTDPNGIAIGGIDIADCLKSAADLEGESFEDAASSGERKSAKRKAEAAGKRCELKVGNLDFRDRLQIGSGKYTFLFESTESLGSNYAEPGVGGYLIDKLAEGSARDQAIPKMGEDGTVNAMGWIVGGSLYLVSKSATPDRAMIDLAEKNLRSQKAEPGDAAKYRNGDALLPSQRPRAPASKARAKPPRQ